MTNKICRHHRTEKIEDQTYHDLEGLIYYENGTWVAALVNPETVENSKQRDQYIKTGDVTRSQIDFCPWCGTKLPDNL